MSETLGKNLKELREVLNISQTVLADSLGITTGAVGLVEKNKSKLKTENLIKLIITYNLNINWLLTGKGQMFIYPKNTFELKQKNIDFKNFNNRLCKLIENSNLDLKTFAGVVDIDFERLADLCVGKKPTTDEIVNICECFNVTSDYLLFGIES